MADRVEELFERFRASGDPAPLGRVYDRLAPQLLALALHVAPGPAEAEDLLQGTFLTAIERAEAWDPARPLRPWLVGILTRLARRQAERRARRPEPERLARPAPRTPPDELGGLELDAEVLRSLERIPDPFRAVLVLRLRHGLEPAEIADALRRPPGTVRSQLQRGLEQLRRALPAGLAGAVLVDLPRAQGLAALRAELLERAAALHAAPASLALPLAGVLTVKTLLAVSTATVAALAIVLSRGPSPVEPAVATPSVVEHPTTSPPTNPTERAVRAGAGASNPLARAAVPGPSTSAPPARELPGETPCTLVVHARWADSGEPVTGEPLILQGELPSSLARGTRVAATDAEGVARVELPPGSHAWSLLRGPRDRATLAPGATLERRYELERGVEVRGRVLDEHGDPLEGATVLLSERWLWDRAHPVATTDREGRYRVRGVLADQYLAASSCGRLRSPGIPIDAEPGTRLRRDLVLASGAAQLRGRVLDPRGEPVAGARVRLGTGSWSGAVRLSDGLAAPGRPPHDLSTDEEGRFEACDVSPGVLPVSVRARGWAPARLRTEAGTGREVVVHLEPEARVYGVVRSRTGAVVPGASVLTAALEPGSPLSAQAGSALDGSFDLGGLPPGEVELEVRHPELGAARTTLLLAAGARVEWSPTLSLAGALHGRVVHGDGAPAVGWTPAAFESEDASRWLSARRTDDTGRFSLDGAREGVSYRLTFHPPGGMDGFPALVVDDVVPGPASLHLVLPDPDTELGAIEARLVDGALEPVPEATLLVWHEELQLWRSFPAKGGRLRVSNVPPGDCRLQVRSRSHAWRDLGTQRVRPGEVLDLGTLELVEPARLVGRVVGGDDARLDTLTFSLVLEDGPGEAGVVRRDGRILVGAPLAAGRARLRVQGDFVHAAEQPLELRPGEEVHVVVRLEEAGLRRVRPVPPPGIDPDWVWLEVRDLAGERVWVDTLHRSGEGLPAARVSAVPGTYRLRARGAGGLEADLDLTIVGHDGGQPELVVPLGSGPR